MMIMHVLQVTASTPAQIQLRYDSLYPSISLVRSLITGEIARPPPPDLSTLTVPP